MEDGNVNRAIRLINQLLKMDIDDEGFGPIMLQARARLALPMSVVLDKVPGDSVVEKCDRIGISRQAYYVYLRGGSRPNKQQAKKLARLTGLKAEAIRAGGHLAPRPTR
jgi:hypothetical protein